MKNQVIEVLNKEHGKKVLKYWTDRGYNCKEYAGGFTKEGEYPFRYYGVIDNEFDNYKLPFVTENNAEIITLPEDRVYPRAMYVSDFLPIIKGIHNKRVVFMEKCGKYLAWAHANTISEAEESINTIAWSYAVDIEDVEKPEPIVEMTMEQICEALGRNVKLIK